MNLVQPIRDKNKIEEMKIYLLKSSYRDYMLFVVGINTGLRISDIIQLKVKHIKEPYIVLKEEKTEKLKRFLINDSLRSELEKYTLSMSPEEYLFPSKKGGPISRVQAYRILNDAAQKVGIKEMGTHTLRKTFGYHHYKTYKDVAILQELFNHSSPGITRRYIGVSQDDMDETVKEFFL